MTTKILVSTKAGNYAQCKQQHLAAGYRIEKEQTVPHNGFCSFVAVKDTPGSEEPN